MTSYTHTHIHLYTNTSNHTHTHTHTHTGLVADCPLTDYNASTCAPTTTDNDGLWTSWLVASEALRYSVTHNNTARVNAVGMFRGLAFLNNVSPPHTHFLHCTLTPHTPHIVTCR